MPNNFNPNQYKIKPVSFDVNKYRQVDQQMFGPKAFDFSNVQKTVQMQAQADALQKQFMSLYQQRLHPPKPKKPKVEKKTYQDAVDYINANKDQILNNDPVTGPESKNNTGAYRIAQEIRNDPNKQAQIKAQGYSVTDYIDALYAAASGGKFRSEREYNQFVSGLKKDTSARDKQYKADHNGMTQDQMFELQQKANKINKPNHDSSGVLDNIGGLFKDIGHDVSQKAKGAGNELSNIWKAISDGPGGYKLSDVAKDTQKTMKKQQKEDAQRGLSSNLSKEVHRGANRAMDAASLGVLSDYRNKENKQGYNWNTDFASNRPVGKGGVTDFFTSGLGYLAPGGLAYKGAKALKVGDKTISGLTKLGASPKLAKTGGLFTEGAVAGGLFGAEQNFADPNMTLKQGLQNIGVNTALGAIADPLLNVAGSRIARLFGKNKVAKSELDNALKDPNTPNEVKQEILALPEPKMINKPVNDTTVMKVPMQYVGNIKNPIALRAETNPNVINQLRSKLNPNQEVAATKQFENISPQKPTGNGGSLKRIDSSQINGPKQEEKILLSQEKQPFNLKRRLNRVYQNTFDTQHLIGGISNDTKVHASNARQTQGITDFIAEHGLVNKEGQKIGVSLKELAQSIPLNKEKDFWRYMAHQHNIARSKEGKNVFSQFNASDSEEVAKELLAKHPEFKEAAKKVNTWINKFMDAWAPDLVGEDKLKLWRQMYPNYIPVYREVDPLKQSSFNGAKRGFVNQHNLVKKAKGAKADLSSNLKDPLGNIVQLVNKTVKAQRNNEVGKAILDEVKKGGLDDLFEVVKTKPSFVDDINKVLKEDGIEGVMDKFTGQFDDVFKQAEKGNNIVKVMENGKEVLLKVKDLDYLKALQSLSDGTGQSAPEQFERAMRKVARPIKELITGKNPLFAIFNIMRDTPNAFIQGSEKNPIKFAMRYMRALKEISHNSKGFQEFSAQGGMQSGFFKNDILKTTTKLKNAKTPFDKLMSKVETFNNLTEATPRYMEYLATLEKGGTKSQAIYNAAEVTTNFARSGKWGKFFDSFVLYLNPALQGLDKFVRQVSNKNTRLGTLLKAGGVITVPQVITDYINKDNPNYQSLDQRTKDDFFLIPNMFGPKDSQGNDETFFRIPKTREYSVVFAVLANRIGEMMDGKSAKDASKGVLGSLDRNFSVPTRPIWSPISDVARNKDWKGAPINSLGMTLDNRSNYLKYDERTSEIGKYLSKALNSQPIDGLKYSPKDIDYLINSYTGIIGDVLLPAATKTEKVTGIPKKKFIADSVYSNQSVNDFYDNLQKLRRLASNKNILGNIPGGATTKEETQRNSLDKISKTIGTLNDKIRKTTDEEQQRKLRKLIIQLSQQGNTLYSQYKGR